ncbi:hypothetical protein KEM48_005548 [Puccinia striiformis f. sp. tritici PST-130]|nr:hypothetical protein KEM48_005548 [Puccinia striiformis f. sp. tritici PST-130]
MVASKIPIRLMPHLIDGIQDPISTTGAMGLFGGPQFRFDLFGDGGSFQGPKSSLARKLTELLMPHLIDRMQDLISTTGGIRQFDGRFDLFGDEGGNFCDKMVAFKVRRRPSLARSS